VLGRKSEEDPERGTMLHFCPCFGVLASCIVSPAERPVKPLIP
jgi:hypothetical protein